MPAECLSEQNANIDALRQETREWFVARHSEQRRMVSDRMQHELRSDDLGLSGKLFLNACPRRMRGGAGKAVMGELGPNKILALDSEYIEGNRAMVGMIRIDLDLIFPSTDHAIAAIRQVVDDGLLPCMPHLITGRVGLGRIRTPGGVETIHPQALIRPHLWILLPRGSAVVATPAGRSKPKRLFTGVARGINLALLHLGADPAANPWLVRGKNPLHEGHWTAALNNSTYPSLEEWSGWVDTRVNAEILARKAAEMKSGAGKSESNVAFTTLRETAYAILRSLHIAQDEAYVAATQPAFDTAALADILYDRMPLSSVDRDTAWNDEAAERILGQVIGYAASAWDPSKATVVQKARGAIRHLTDGMTTKEAQEEAGRHSGKGKADTALEALVQAYRNIEATGKKPTRAGVAKLAGLSTKTAERRWADVIKNRTIGV